MHIFSTWGKFVLRPGKRLHIYHRRRTPKWYKLYYNAGIKVTCLHVKLYECNSKKLNRLNQVRIIWKEIWYTNECVTCLLRICVDIVYTCNMPEHWLTHAVASLVKTVNNSLTHCPASHAAAAKGQSRHDLPHSARTSDCWLRTMRPQWDFLYE